MQHKSHLLPVPGYFTHHRTQALTPLCPLTCLWSRHTQHLPHMGNETGHEGPVGPGAQGSVERAGHSRTCDGPFPAGGAWHGCEQEPRVGALQPPEITAGDGQAEGIVLRGTYEQCSEGQEYPGLPCVPPSFLHSPTLLFALFPSFLPSRASAPSTHLPPFSPSTAQSILLVLPHRPPAITPSLVHRSGTSPLPATRVP